MIPRTDYLNALIDKPWSVENNCWALVRDVQRDLFGRILPEVPATLAAGTVQALAAAFARHPERDNWREVTTPVDGAIALMARRSADVHCGVYLTTPQAGIVHRDEAQGVRYEPVLTLGFYWHRIRYFVPA